MTTFALFLFLHTYSLPETIELGLESSVADPDPKDPHHFAGSGSAWKVGSGSASKRSGSATLFESIPSVATSLATKLELLPRVWRNSRKPELVANQNVLRCVKFLADDFFRICHLFMAHVQKWNFLVDASIALFVWNIRKVTKWNFSEQSGEFCVCFASLLLLSLLCQ